MSDAELANSCEEAAEDYGTLDMQKALRESAARLRELEAERDEWQRQAAEAQLGIHRANEFVTHWKNISERARAEQAEADIRILEREIIDWKTEDVMDRTVRGVLKNIVASIRCRKCGAVYFD